MPVSPARNLPPCSPYSSITLSTMSVLTARWTTWVYAADALPAKVASPEYVALTACVPPDKAATA